MADDGERSNTEEIHVGSVKTSQLRTVAQMAYLDALDKSEKQEQEEDRKRKESERYLNLGQKSRSRSKDGSPVVPAAKAPKLRSAQDVLDRLRWDPSLKNLDFVVGYLERFEGLKEIPLQAWIKESTDEEWIPQHRIKYFKDSQGEVVWHRDERIDKIFGTGLGAGDSL